MTGFVDELETRICMLTTVDNPYDPFTQWDEWFAFDVLKGHNCCGMLAKFAYTSDALSQADNHLEISNAIDEIIKYDPLHIYKKAFQKEEN